MERPDLLVVDLDGTLLNRQGEISQENLAALHRAEQEGLPLIVATGRTASECRPILEQIKGTKAFIGASGSLLTHLATEQTIDRRVMAPTLVQQVLETCPLEDAAIMLLKDQHQTGVDYIVVGDADLHPVSQWWFEITGASWHRISRIEDDPHPEHTVRAGAVGSPCQFDPMVERIDDAMGKAVLARHWEAVTSSSHAGTKIHLLEVFHPEADKWTMIQSWCAHANIACERTAAVGDGLNDVMMIKRSRLGIAMANADHRVLAVADAVTGDHDHHGVAELIDDLLDGRLHLGMSEQG